MNIARILYPVQVLGPGKRVGVWLSGCPRRCPGCSNPELWNFQNEYEMDSQDVADMIARAISNQEIDGFTITGGDPFYQPKALAALLSHLQEISEDILVYTGYIYEELLQSCDKDVHRALSMTGVLVDGPYIEAKNDGSILRGSNNQRIIVLNSKLEGKYNRYLLAQSNNQIQNFTTKDGIISVGIHRPGFNSEVTQRARERGVLTDG